MPKSEEELRIPPLKTDQFPAGEADKLGDFAKMNFVRVMLNNPELHYKFSDLLRKVVSLSGLPKRDRQIACLRTLTLGGDVYEVTHHEFISEGAELNAAEVKAMRAGQGSELGEFDNILNAAIEQLVREQFISDDIWAKLSERYTKAQLLEFIILVGTYLTMAMITRNSEMQVEDEKTFRRFAEIRDYK